MDSCNAELLEQNGQKDGFDIKLTSAKALVVGKNDFVVELSKDSKVVDNAKSKNKILYAQKCQECHIWKQKKMLFLVDGKYKVSVNVFLWVELGKYQLKFKTSDDGLFTQLKVV